MIKSSSAQRERWRINKATSRGKRRAKGLCPDCGKPRTSGKSLCASCAYKRLIRGKRYWRKHPGLNAKNKKCWKAKLMKENRCCECGKPLSDDEDKYCNSCRAEWHKGGK